MNNLKTLANEIQEVSAFYSELFDYGDNYEDLLHFVASDKFYKIQSQISKWKSKLLTPEEIKTLKSKFKFSKDSRKREQLWEDCVWFCEDLFHLLKDKEYSAFRDFCNGFCKYEAAEQKSKTQ